MVYQRKILYTHNLQGIFVLKKVPIKITQIPPYLNYNN